MNFENGNNQSAISKARWVGITIISLGVCGLVFALKTCDSTDKATSLGDKVLKLGSEFVGELPAIAKNFKTGTITHTFSSRTTEITSTKGDILEIATSRNDETFIRKDSKNILWWIYIGTTVSEIRVPATFRYHIRLSDAWHLAVRDNTCVVLAPAICASLPPAIDTQQMVKKTESGWARFNKDENLAELERSITPDLESRAMDESHLRLVREACRQAVAEFVKKWLMKEDQWRQDRFHAIIVVFPDEKQFKSDADLERYNYEPTVKLK